MNRSNLEKHTRNYLLPAVSAQAHLKRNNSTKALRSSTPRYFCDVLLEEVQLSLQDVSNSFYSVRKQKVIFSFK